MSEPNCPNKKTLANYAIGKIEETNALEIEQHLAGCEACRSVLSELGPPSDDLVLALANQRRNENLDTLTITDKDTGIVDLPQVDPAAIGDWIGPYKLVEKVGEGGMGLVYRAEQFEPVQRTVALKVIKAGMDTSQVIKRFEAERQALAMMEHPGIARVLDAGATDSGRPFFVMEYVPGERITNYSDTNKLSIDERLHLFRRVCLAVHHAHQKGIIHRDLKPSNILVSEADEVPLPKIIDFGLAKATEQPINEQSQFTRHGQVVGTLEYMSPEQASVTQGGVDTRTDIYSLGVVLYELLTGMRPLDSGQLRDASLAEMIRIIREDEPPKPSARLNSQLHDSAVIAGSRQTELRSLVSVLKGDLDWIVLKCLEKDRDRRYGSASELARDIDRYLANLPIEARPPSALYQLTKLYRRNRVSVIATGVVILSLIAGVIGTTLALFESQRQAEIAERRANQLETGTGVMAGIFRDLDLAKARDANEPVAAVLASRLQQAAKTLTTESVGEPSVVADLQFQLGVSLDNLGAYQPALDLLQESLETVTELYGQNSQQALKRGHLMAVVHRQMGNFGKADELITRVVAERKKLLGEDHLETLEAISEKAMVLSVNGRYQDAIDLDEKVLAVRRRVLGPRHADTLHSMTNLAISFSELGQYQEALELDEEVFIVRNEVLGPMHLDTILTTSNLGFSYLQLGRYEESLKFYSQVHEARRDLLGAKHPETVHAQGDLVSPLAQLGRYKEARQICEQVMELRKEILGPTHPDTLGSMSNLSVILSDMGESEESLKIDKQVLEIRKETLGPTHPDTILSLSNLSSVLGELKRYEECLSYDQQAIEAFKKKLGPKHPSTLTAMNNLGLTLSNLGRLDEALEVFNDVHAISVDELGADHPDTITLLSNVAFNLSRMGYYRRSVEIGEQVVEQLTQSLGPKHPITLVPRSSLAFNYSHLHRLEALELSRKVLEDRREVIGEEHPKTIASLNTVSSICNRLGKYQQAVDGFRELIEIRQRLQGKDHRETMWSEMNLLVNRTLLGEKTVEPFDQLVTRMRSTLGEENIGTLLAEANRAEAIMISGNLAEALSQYRTIHSQIAKHHGPESSSALDVLHSLAATELAAGKSDEAKARFKRLVKLRIKQAGPHHIKTMAALCGYAEALLLSEDFKQAEQACRKSLQMQKDQSERYYGYYSAYGQSILGRALWNRGQRSTAEAPLLAAAQEFEQLQRFMRSYDRHLVEDNIGSIVRLYKEQGDAKAAQEWQSQLDSFE